MKTIIMKKIIAIICFGLIASQFSSCKQEQKKEVKPVVETKSSFAYSLSKATNEIGFTAYKTTDKVPVKGMFKTVRVVGGGEGNTIKEAMNGAEISIPIGSIETNDAGRNVKIQTFFFKVMEATGTLKGKLTLQEDAKGTVAFTMNGITKDLPITYTINGNEFCLDAVLDINEWNGQTALASLNTACKALHTGGDGVSKTWNDVAIHIVSKF